MNVTHYHIYAREYWPRPFPPLSDSDGRSEERMGVDWYDGDTWLGHVLTGHPARAGWAWVNLGVYLDYDHPNEGT